MLSRIDLNCYIAALQSLHLMMFKKNPEHNTTILLQNALESAKNSLKTHLMLEQKYITDETIISSYQITLMKMQKDMDKLKKENEELLKLL